MTRQRVGVGVSLLVSVAFACGGGGGPPNAEEQPIGRIAFISDRDGNNDVFVVNADGTGLKNLTKDPADDGTEAYDGDANFDWSPDGKKIAFVTERDGNPEIYVMNADGSRPERLTNTAEEESHPRWSPDGGRIAFILSTQGPGSTDVLYTMQNDGSDTRRSSYEESHANYPDWSPDGAKIAFQASDIFVVNPDGSGLKNLTGSDEIGEGNERYFAPVWSPDGSRIAFYAYRDSTVEGKPGLYEQIFIMKADGGGQILVPDGANEDDYYARPSWSPDGKRIVFSSDEGPGWNLHVMDADGSSDRRITEPGALLGVWSPHQDWIAALSWEPPVAGQDGVEAGLYLMRHDGSDRRKITGDFSEAHFAWSPVP